MRAYVPAQLTVSHLHGSANNKTRIRSPIFPGSQNALWTMKLRCGMLSNVSLKWSRTT